ncbi:MAG: alpha-L-fucosidase [Chitinophaga sp.]|uniref:alpha-L-fucosidase n=1 Tax=Chitinophaga sp. TaxID=1869181 RepID=UPI001B15AB0E|nr:alpha-L-fucosidase [Chitinophaga sp.]MBO9732621.1 alpha-L-fucosidase [Chitinophaga sp.]
MQRIGKILTTLLLLTSIATAQRAPKPYGPVPNGRQKEWYNWEMIAFFHFGINTFEDFVNEGEGKVSTAIFNPTALDCRQWVTTLKNAGIPCGILVAKHADGFCNWPSAYTDYSVKNSLWKGGNGDLVKEYTDACKALGIKPALYLGPHDRHQHLSPVYNTGDYSDYYARQLSELLRNYGPIWEIWWDGAGADELTTPLYTRWADTVRKLQPQCVIFGTKNSYRFADVRWVGNESGKAGDPCWATIDSISIRDESQHIQALNEGQLNGNAYIPAETDVSIRPSWFYHKEEDDKVKSPSELWNIYCNTVGHNSVLLLNIPPDRRGLLHSVDSSNLVQLRRKIENTFAVNLLTGSTVSSLHPRGKNYLPANLTDANAGSYYATPDGYTTDTVTFTLKAPATFDCLMAQEVLELGQRTTGWSVDYSSDGKTWTPIPAATNKQTIGHKWIICFPPVTAKKVRLRITAGQASPAIHTFGVYKQAAYADINQ